MAAVNGLLSILTSWYKVTYKFIHHYYHGQNSRVYLCKYSFKFNCIQNQNHQFGRETYKLYYHLGKIVDRNSAEVLMHINLMLH